MGNKIASFWKSRHRLLALVLAVPVLMVFIMGLTAPVAEAAQVGTAGQVTLNPGGGLLTNGSDGIRFTMNSTSASGNPNYAYAGADAIVHRNTYQYCCGAGAPMLNIGGTLVGTAGPAAGSQQWNTFEVLSTSGAAVVGTRTSATGNSAATVRYTAIVGGRTYTVTRAVSYTYPNDYVTDSYTFVIPDGNTSTVKFYLGGDTAPGSSDSGYGIMLTSPVRSVISLNTSSQIMFGLREISGGRTFDGATSQHYSAPYTAVSTGGNIGFVVTSSTHDAGLMMQWNLGSTPSTQTASLQQFATRQGTNLNAVLSATTTDAGDPVSLDISIANTVLSTVSGLGYTFTLPAGLVIDTTTVTNSCGGTLTAVAGSTSVVLSGASVNSGSNCVVAVPIITDTAGTYAISSTNFSSLVGAITNNVGATALTVINPTLGADVNGDGVDDSSQPNFYTYTSSVTNKTVGLQVDAACTVTSALSEPVSVVGNEDTGYEYVNGLMNFKIACGTPGFSATIRQYYYDVSPTDMVLRKYDPNTEAYTTIDDATITQQTINGHTVTVVTYEVVDGGPLDTDGAVDGSITDPAGLASLAGAGGGTTSGGTAGVPNTGLESDELAGFILVSILGLIITASLTLRHALYGKKARE